MKCQAYKSCRRKAKYLHPNYWCSKHWRMWWEYGMKGKELPYMLRKRVRRFKPEGESIWTKRQVEELRPFDEYPIL